MSDCPQITYKKRSFLSSMALGLSALAITVIISGAVVVVYGMNFIAERSDKIVATVGSAISGLPELQKSLPPVLADILDDRRGPEYRDKIQINARIDPLADHGGRMRTVVEVANKGNEIVTLLSLRITVFDAHNEVIAESNEWAATPIAADRDWRGPLMPGSDRHFVAYPHKVFHTSSLDNLRTKVEITDVRIWNRPDETALANSD